MSCNNNGEQLNIIRGITFNAKVRWEDNAIAYKAITGITQSAPAVISSVGHNIPAGWRVTIVSVKGMDEINALNSPPKENDYHKSTTVDANSISLNNVNASDYTAYKSGGYIQFNSPVDLTGFTARMQIRGSLGSTVKLEEITTEDIRLPNTGIVIDNTAKTIEIKLANDITEAYTFSSGVYSLELISSTGIVSRVIAGDVVCVNDVTR